MRRPFGLVVALLLGGTLPAAAAPAAITLSVPGIACKACAGDIQGQLTALAGVTAVQVDISRKQVVVRFDDARTAVTAMLKAIDDMGFRGTVLKQPAASGKTP